MKNLKFVIDNVSIAKAVSEKIKSLAESGVINHPNVYPEGYDITPLFVYIDKNGIVKYGLDNNSFDEAEETQIHYLNFLTDSREGRLFTNSVSNNIYIQIGDTAYWIDSYTKKLDSHPFELDKTLTMRNGNWLIDVNENVLK